MPYGKVYPFGEALAGILIVAGALPWVSGPVALFIGTVGAFSVFKAVYIEKRELKCACVGGSSIVPLGFVFLTESLVMMGLGAFPRRFGFVSYPHSSVGGRRWSPERTIPP